MSTTDSTDLTGYDIVMAITQEALNAALSYSAIWALPINYNLSLNPIPPNEPLDPSTPQSQCDGLYNTYMAPPSLSLTLPNGATNTNQVAVTLTFNSGTLQYFSSSSRSEKSVDVSGWTISFLVDIALADVPGNTDNSGYPDAVREALSNPSLSVKQLFLNLIEIDWTDAKFLDGDQQPVTDLQITGTLQQSLEGYFRSLDAAVSQAVLSWVQAAPGSGQSPSTTPAGAIPGLVPTLYEFTVSPYSPSGEYDGLGTVNFLMMTQNRSSPLGDNKSAGIFSSNWVAAPNTSQSAGTFCLRKGLFDDAYVVNSLLPAIAKVIGISAPILVGDISNDVWNFSSTLSLYTDENGGEGRKVEDGFDEDIYETITESANCTVTLYPHASPPYFNVSGFYTGVLNITGDALLVKDKYTVTCSQSWSFQIQIKAGANGTIAAEPVKGDDGKVAITYGAYSQDIEGDNWLGDLTAALSGLINSITDTFESNFSAQAQSLMTADYSGITAGIGSALDSLSACIVFPGGRNYAYSSLSFSTGGEENLLSSVTLKE